MPAPERNGAGRATEPEGCSGHAPGARSRALGEAKLVTGARVLRLSWDEAWHVRERRWRGEPS